MSDPKKRADFSKFLIHLTKDSDQENNAIENLVKILKERKIEARNSHCLFTRKFDQMKFSDVLKRKFNTVCFTEIPLHQIHRITSNIPGRKVQLKPYGIVFWRSDLLKKGANPAIYINADNTGLRKYLMDQFENCFSEASHFKKLKNQQLFYNEIIQYYSLVNIIAERCDFSWEREWRHQGNFGFEYVDMAAIISENPDDFLGICEEKLSEKDFEHIQSSTLSNYAA